ncbi:DUF4236 domain-containing protein [Litchfieldella rifensis]|uniref:DUF4236 domain-containing protein n=1 Tax=Litchfieldella rifensis TaxID=762643 RepID=A0ABV7LIS8_9GAMM
MGFRFQRCIRLAPGIRLNASKSELRLSVGPRGASPNVGSSGVPGHAGTPDTELAYCQERISVVTRRAPLVSQGMNAALCVPWRPC